MMTSTSWLRLELRYLLALQAVATSRSFSRAADELGYTQSAVTQQIASLERLVGEPLIDRPGGPRPVALTPAGVLLLSHADAILARMRIAQAQLEALSNGDAGTLRVGTYQSVGVRILPGAIARLADSHPAFRPEIYESADDVELVEMVGHGRLDVAFCVLPVEGSCFATTELLRDPYVLLVPADSALKGTRVRLEALGSVPLIGYRGCRTQQRIESYLRGLGIDVKRVGFADDNAIIQGLVAEGRGMALVTELSIDASDPRTVALQVDDWVPPRRVGLAWHVDQTESRAIQAFVVAAREVIDSRRSAVRPAA